MSQSRILSRLLAFALVVLMTACSLPIPRPTDPKTPDEQLYLSKAIERAIKDSDLGIPEGTSITLEASGLVIDQSLKGDISSVFARDVLHGWLGKQGLIIRQEEKDATLSVRMIIESLGARRGVRMFGMPATESAWLPIATPELALYKRDFRQGIARFYFDIFDTESGRFVRSTDSLEGHVTTTVYTALFFIRWQKSDLEKPLEIE